jgi:hypothetical protein
MKFSTDWYFSLSCSNRSCAIRSFLSRHALQSSSAPEARMLLCVRKAECEERSNWQYCQRRTGKSSWGARKTRICDRGSRVGAADLCFGEARRREDKQKRRATESRPSSLARSLELALEGREFPSRSASSIHRGFRSSSGCSRGRDIDTSSIAARHRRRLLPGRSLPETWFDRACHIVSED